MDWPKGKTKAQGQQWIEYSVQESKVYVTIALISHANKIMLKILQARLQQYMNCELSDVQANVLNEKAEEPEIKLPTFVGSWKKQEKNNYFCFID